MNEQSTRTRPEASVGDRLPLTLEQMFLHLQHDHDGSSAGFGPRQISSGGWQLTGRLDMAALRQALDDVVARHEPLRSVLAADNSGMHQTVCPPSPVKLVIRDLSVKPGTSRELAAEEFLNNVESGVFDASTQLLLWAHLGRFDDENAVLALLAYQPQIDVWSIHLIMRDLAACYAARVTGQELAPPLGAPYRDYIAWQGEHGERVAEPASIEFWRTTLRDPRPMVLSADSPPSTGVPGGTRRDRFTLDAEVGTKVRALARSLRSSPFMVLFAVYLIHLRRLTGINDGVVWTLTPGPGRRHHWWTDTVGYFVNMFPLRVDLTGCTMFRQFVERVRASCLRAYPHEIPFVRLAQEAPEQIGALEQAGMVVPGFQMSPHEFTQGEHSVSELAYTPIRRRVSQALSPDIPDDAMLWTIEITPQGELIGAVNSSVDRFRQDTVNAMIADFQAVLRQALADPDTPWTDPAPDDHAPNATTSAPPAPIRPW